jgi:outer membrane protein assembly factor BamB
MRLTIFLLAVIVISSCRKKDLPMKSSYRNISSFVLKQSDDPTLFADVVGVISHDTIFIGLSKSINASNLVPTVTYAGASLSPSSKTPQDLSKSVLYTVTAEDGSATTYRTISTFLSGTKAITSFIFKKENNPDLANDIPGVIAGDSIIANIPPGIDITSLKPTIVYTGVSMTPGNEEAGNFVYPVGYTVSAEDGSTRNYNVIVNGNSDIFIHADDGYLYALNAMTGGVIWKYNVGGNGVPTYDNGVVFAAGQNNVVYAINAIDGSLKWSSPFSQGTNYSLTMPAVKYGKVYFSGTGYLFLDPNSNNVTYANFIYAVDEQTGTQDWMSPFTYNSYSNPPASTTTNVTVEDNIALVYDVFSGMHALSASDGTPLWTGTFGELGRGNAAIAGNSVVCGIEGGIAESDESGNQSWYIHDNGNYTSPTVNNGIIYTTASYSNGSTIYAIHQSGGIEWQISPFTSSAVAFYAPFFSNDNLYISNSLGELGSYRASDGSANWKKQHFGVYPVVVNANIYISDDHKMLNCLEASTGNIKWICPSGGIFSGASCVVDSKNVVYHCTDSGEQN